MRQAENSEVLPFGSVAVAVMKSLRATGMWIVMEQEALPEAFVVTLVELMNVLPSP